MHTNAMKFVFGTLFILGLVANGWAGGWTQKKGEGYFKLGQSALRSTQYFEPDDSIVDIVTTSVYFSSVYAEYGLTDRLTAIAYVPFFARVTVNNVEFTSGARQEGDALNSFGDTDLGLKYGILQGKPFVLSATFFLGLPLGEPAGGESGALQTGDGEFNQYARLEAGYGVPNSPVYFNAYTGINHRTEGFSEEFRYGFEVGYRKNQWLAAFKMDGIESFQNGDPGGTANGLFSNNIEFLGLTPEVAYFAKDNFWVTANVGLAAFGRRVLAAPSWSAGIFWNI